MSAPPASGPRALLQRRASGIAFLLVIAGLVYLTVLFYQKAFTPVIHVALKADRIGNQLSAPADVKLRGLVVGEVRAVHSTGDGATIDLALQPGKVNLIPSNVRAQLLPKTLFGEKFVNLVIPAQSSEPMAKHLREGSVITQDHSSTALETEKVLDDLMPLLQSLRPAELSMTLNALSGALRGRGDKLGANFAATGVYLRQLNPELPRLALDMQGLADFTNNTADALPDLLRVLDNFSANSRNLVVEQASLDRFLKTTDAFSASADSILAQNSQRLIALSHDSLPSLDLYARYSPEFPCLAKGLADYEPIVARTFGGAQPGLHITLEVVKDRGPYVPGQSPKYLDGRAPYCDGLPRPSIPAKDKAFADGYNKPQGGGSGTGAGAASYLDPTGQAGRSAVVNAVAAPLLGVPADQVPDIASVLFAPLASGSAVGLA